MKKHELKIYEVFFDAILAGEKTFEIRYNDRDFKVGDELLLVEHVFTTIEPTGREKLVKVLYMSDYAQQDGYVVMAIASI